MKAMRLIRKSLAPSLKVSLVFALLLATLGIPLSQHLCGGRVVDSRIYAEAKGCGMAEESFAGIAIENPPCCKNQHELLQAKDLENDGPILSPQIDPNPQIDLFPAYSPQAVFSTALVQRFASAQAPPGQSKSILALYQTFLI